MKMYVCGAEVELPKLTVKLLERFTEVSGIDNVRDKAKAMYELMSDVLGSEVVANAADGANFETCDLVELVSLFTRTDAAYRDEMEREQRNLYASRIAEAREMANEFGGIADNAQKIKEITEAKRSNNRQKFTVVR